MGLVLLASSVACGQESPSLVGERVFAKSADVPIKAEDKVVGTGADLVYPGKVRKANGEWLLIESADSKTKGWIRRDDVCTTAEAVEYFTQRIATNPNDDDALCKRGMAKGELSQFDHAVHDLTHSIQLRPKAAAYCYRGAMWVPGQRA